MRHLLAASAMLAASFALSAPPKVVEEFVGRAVSVADGDTITVLRGTEQVRVRLEGIDAPESRQAFGNRAKQSLASMVSDKEVTIRKTGTDRYGRTLGIVVVDGIDANAKLVENGLAWHYRQFNREERLARLEVAARQAKRGLWADPSPLPPWEFRARQRAPTTSPATAPLSFWLNTSSDVRHNSTCEHYRNTRQGRPCGPTDGRPCGRCGG